MPEPGNPQSLNRYSYALNNPLKYTDPTGRFNEEELLGYGVSQEYIDRWKETDLAWWQLLFDASVWDYVQKAQNKPTGPMWQFVLVDFKLDHMLPQLLLANTDTNQVNSLGYFQSVSQEPLTHYDLIHNTSCSISDGSHPYRVSYFGETVGPRQKQRHIYYDFGAVNPLSLGLDIGGMASIAAAQYAQSDSLSNLSGVASASIAGIQAGVQMS